jgi:hypothetical protein
LRNVVGRGLLAACVTGLGLSVASPAAAAPQSAPLAQSAWFFTTIANQVGSPEGLPVAEPTGVPKGDYAVAYTAGKSGASSKETLLQFGLPHDAASSTITSLIVSLTLDSSPTAPQAAAAKAPVVACLPTRGWSPGEAQDSSNEPSVDCRDKVAGVWKGNTVSFSIAKFAQSWVDDTNLGVAIVNDPKNLTQPYQAVFSGGKAITAKLDYTVIADQPHHDTHHHTTTSSGHQHQDSNFGGGGGGGGGGGSFNPSVPTINVPTDTGTTSVAPGAQSPVIAGSGTQSDGGAKPVLSSASTASSAPPLGFWTAGACLLILLVGAGLALNPSNPVGPTRSSRGRLDRLLRDPQRLASLNARSQP